jgi:hypothetical protein
MVLELAPKYSASSLMVKKSAITLPLLYPEESDIDEVEEMFLLLDLITCFN